MSRNNVVQFAAKFDGVSHWITPSSKAALATRNPQTREISITFKDGFDEVEITATVLKGKVYDPIFKGRAGHKTASEYNENFFKKCGTHIVTQFRIDVCRCGFVIQ